MWWRSGDEADRYSGKDGRQKRRKQNRLLAGHPINLLEIFEMSETSPAIFPIDQAKYDAHRTNSVVDCPKSITVLCFAPISSEMNSTSPGGKIGFSSSFSGDGRETA